MMNRKQLPLAFIISSVILLVAIAIGGTALGFSISVYTKAGLKLLGYEGAFDDDLVIKCTNSTPVVGISKKSGDVSIKNTCQITGNKCLESICNVNGMCEEVAVSGATCFEDRQCSTNGTYFCSDSCQCEPVSFPLTQCEVSADCPSVLTSQCYEFVCDSQTCVQNFTVGSDCAADTDCPYPSVCRDCVCTQTNATKFTEMGVITSPTLSGVTFFSSLNWFDGIYYRYDPASKLLQMNFYLQAATSSVNRAKSLEVDISALGFFLDTLKRGTGIATIAAATTWTLDTTVCEGTGSASVSSGTTIIWRFYCNDTPTGASATTHYLSGTFYGFVE